MPQPTSAQLGAAIRQARNARGLSLEDLAAKSRVHWTSISVIENGKRNPGWNVVANLATGLEMDIAELARMAAEQPGAG